jgi:TonB-linked SusC/RagA family outer membrane protein
MKWLSFRSSFLIFFFPTLFFFFRTSAQAPDRIVKGTVYNERREPVPFVSITVAGREGATLSDSLGNFSIRCGDRSLLSFSSAGYEPRQVLAGAGSTLTITLRAKSNLEDVIVIGYGERRKSEVTGAISTVKSSELLQTPIANLAQGLQGRVAGAQITQNNAAPGGSISVRIRGTNSINGSSEPLYVIDGIQVQNNTGGGLYLGQTANGLGVGNVGGGANEISPLSSLNPDDIESIEVLKDASASAIYGSQAANGVVIITTRRGKAGATKISYDGYTGIQNVTKMLSVMKAPDFARLENQIYNDPNRFPKPDSLGAGTDWQKQIFRQAKMQNHQLTFSGGNDKTQLLMSFNYFDQTGVVLNSKLDRYAVRINLDHQATSWLKMGTSTTFTRTINHRIQTGSVITDQGALQQSIVGAALAAPPVLKPYNADGSIFDFGAQVNGNYAELRDPVTASKVMDNTTANTVLSDIYFDFNIARGLHYKASLDIFTNNTLGDFYFPASAFSMADRASNGGLGGFAAKNNSNFIRVMHESVLSYDKTIARKHTFRLTGVFSALENNSNTNYIIAQGFVNDATTNEALQLAQTYSVFSDRSKDDLLSWLGRVSYNYMGKYFLDISGRSDGSSKFGENNKYGFFPAASLAYNISKEAFLANIKAITSLKFRLSYGRTGNQGALGPYQSLATVASGSDYDFNGVYTRGIAPTLVPNPDLRWEKSTQSNAGMDLDLFNNRLHFTVDAYYKKTNDLLFAKALPLSSGYATVTGNFASLENKGLEIATNFTPIRTKDLTWTVNANISFNRNKLLRLADDSTKTFDINNYNILQVGQPLGIFKTYVFDGIQQTGQPILPGQPNPRVGTQKVKDISGPAGKPDGVISDADRIITGNANPKFVFGFSTNINYKRFDFAALFAGVYGNQIYNLANYQLENPIGSRNALTGLINRWTPTNPNNVYQTGAGSLNGRLPISNRYIEDGSFLRCKNISVGYTLPKIRGLSAARIYLSANNVFLLTSYTGFDPEVGTFGGSNTQIGVDNIVYPQSRSFLAGLQITF